MMGPLYPTSRLSEATRLAESFMLGRYDRYCKKRRRNPLARETLITFLDSRLPFITPREVYLEGRAIRRRFIDAGLPDPQGDTIVAAAIESIQQRAEKVMQIPLIERIMHRIIDANRRDIIGARDIAIVQLLYAPRLTMIQICRLEHPDVHFTLEGCTIRVADARGKIRFVRIDRLMDPRYCPVSALERWIDYTKGEGVIFRTMARGFGRPLQPTGIERILRAALLRAGIDIKYAKRRALTLAVVAAAAQVGFSDGEIREQLGFSGEEVVRRWKERAGLHLQGSTERLGL